MNLTDIHELHRRDLKNPLHPSIFFKDNNYDLFILRLPNNFDGYIDGKSDGFVITESNYYYFNKDSLEFEELVDSKGFTSFINKEIDKVLDLVYDYSRKIEDIEDSFYEGKISRNFNKQWVKYKNELIKINRILFKTIEVFDILIREYMNDKDYLEKKFEDMREHLTRAHRASGMALEKLDALHNSYIIENNEQMNRTVYFLTLLSAIFLPLNLIVGFFGMNTSSLPLTQIDGGTFKVINILVFSGIISTLLIYFVKKR